MKQFILVVFLLLNACASSPNVQFFALEPVPPLGPKTDLSGAPITLSAMRLPPMLDRLEIVRRGENNSIEVSETDRWAAPLDEMARLVLTEDLALRSKAELVVDPDMPKVRADLRSLSVYVKRFDAEPSGEVVLTCDWTLVAGNPPRPMSRLSESILVRSDGASQAARMSTALGLLADRIVGVLRKSGY